ncbi:MAG: aminotransferase class V-fold PLP-dependent enzyme [Thermaerobacter sp.]|nr:aminotransferase class V-fold PLP-dependent enzyme [Thermaerobacter sp.]
MPLAAYANGLRLPVRAIADAAQRAGARVVVDAYQGVGVIPVDVRTLSAHYHYLFTGARDCLFVGKSRAVARMLG